MIFILYLPQNEPRPVGMAPGSSPLQFSIPSISTPERTPSKRSGAKRINIIPLAGNGKFGWIVPGANPMTVEEWELIKSHHPVVDRFLRRGVLKEIHPLPQEEDSTLKGLDVFSIDDAKQIIAQTFLVESIERFSDEIAPSSLLRPLLRKRLEHLKKSEEQLRMAM